MRSVVYDRYGGPDVLHMVDIEKPVPKDDEVLVQVSAVAVTRADCATREANRRSGRGVELASRAIFGFRRPRQPILGGDFSGVVAAVGQRSRSLPQVTRSSAAEASDSARTPSSSPCRRAHA